MTSKAFPTTIVTQAQSVIEAWKKIDPALQMGDLNLAALENDFQQATPVLSQIDSLEAQLTDMRNRRDALFEGLWEKLKRTRAAVRGIYGDDSSEYEMMGGKRLSERKSPTRKKPAS